MYNGSKITSVFLVYISKYYYLCITNNNNNSNSNMKKYDFDKLEYKSFVSKKLGVRAEFHQVFGIMFLRFTDLNTGVEIRDEFASPSEIDYLLKQNGI